MSHSLLEIILLLLLLSTVTVALFQHLRLSPILGYLSIGVLTGPYALGWLPESEETQFLGELGVIFLMFSIGLDLSLPTLLAARRMVLGIGGAQVLVTTLVFALSAWLLGVPLGGAFTLGGALAMSSTAIVLKQLQEQMELLTRHGRLAIGILLFQDLTIIPFLVILPLLAKGQDWLTSFLIWELLKAGLIFLGLVFAGRWLLHPVLGYVAAIRSQELFMLSALLLALSAAWISELGGLSPALGAFMAGMFLGETEFRHQVEADIRPFQDLLLGLFFVTIGMQLNIQALPQLAPWIALLLPLFILTKMALIAALASAFREPLLHTWRTSISLAHGGEFGLLVLSMAIGYGILEPFLAQILLAIMILSMTLAPVMVRFNGSIAHWLLAQPQKDIKVEKHIEIQAETLEKHVIICGYGRLGQNLARFLDREQIPYLALDLDIERIHQASSAGEPVVYGDSTHPGILRAAGLEQARALVITFGEATIVQRVIGQVRSHHLDLPILVRSVEDRHEYSLRRAGATEVFPEGLEISVTFAGQLLLLLGIPLSRVEQLMNEARESNYRPLRTFFHDTNESEERARDYRHQLRAITLTDQDAAIGKAITELELKKYGVTLMNVRRGGIRVPGATVDTRLRPGDVLVLSGLPEALEQTVISLTQTNSK
ncbi:cation:proton antiporter [Nitrosococcus wardiae]|uniref:Potassium transporter n=1 Tax=Nitrosococcus wardiae TaxID=1814290 RepID=A0A4V1AW02_9GAMM|nr:cation:proton antiporter [Nitrosococcus wardiae]QBQ54925.1 potassium transporter [Nitrosococcus wardiae]